MPPRPPQTTTRGLLEPEDSLSFIEVLKFTAIFSSKCSIAMEEISRNSCSTSWGRNCFVVLANSLNMLLISSSTRPGIKQQILRSINFEYVMVSIEMRVSIEVRISE